MGDCMLLLHDTPVFDLERSTSTHHYGVGIREVVFNCMIGEERCKNGRVACVPVPSPSSHPSLRAIREHTRPVAQPSSLSILIFP